MGCSDCGVPRLVARAEMCLAAVLGGLDLPRVGGRPAQDPFKAAETIAATEFFGETLEGDAGPVSPVLRTAEFFGETPDQPALEPAMLARG